MKPIVITSVIERFRGFFRHWAWIFDAAAAVFVALLSLVSRPTLSFATWPHTASTLIVIGCSLAIGVRRVRPRLALTVIATLLFTYLLAAIELGVWVAVVCMIAAYTAQSQLDPPWRWGFLAAMYSGAIAAVFVSPIPSVVADWQARLIAAGIAVILLTIATLAGVVRRQHRARYDLAVERAIVLEAQHDAERRLAASEERARIAREMHDILGHSLNAIAVQAEGVRYVLDTDTRRADQALSDIGQLSRRAVSEVRDLIDILSTNETELAMRPMPNLRDVTDLVASLKYTKAAIRLRIDGDLDTVPGHVSLTAYRIIQESLTNALKHADGAPISVRIDAEGQRVFITVLNSVSRAQTLTSSNQNGRGIIGMKERASVVGGNLEAGPDRTTGGWQVAAILPWSRA